MPAGGGRMRRKANTRACGHAHAHAHTPIHTHTHTINPRRFGRLLRGRSNETATVQGDAVNPQRLEGSGQSNATFRGIGVPPPSSAPPPTPRPARSHHSRPAPHARMPQCAMKDTELEKLQNCLGVEAHAHMPQPQCRRSAAPIGRPRPAIARGGPSLSRTRGESGAAASGSRPAAAAPRARRGPASALYLSAVATSGCFADASPLAAADFLGPFSPKRWSILPTRLIFFGRA